LKYAKAATARSQVSKTRCLTRLAGMGVARRLTLVVRNLMTGLVDARKAEVAILAYLAVFRTINHHRRVTCGTELVAVSVLHRKTDSFTTKPVA